MGVFRTVAILAGLMFATCTVAQADQYVGGDRGSAMFVAWTSDSSGHLQGQVQTVAHDPNNPAKSQSANASFTGTRQGSEISLVFPLMSPFGGETWTGRVGWRSVTLDVPSSNGTPLEITLTAGSFADFQRRVSGLRYAAAQASTAQTLAKNMQDAQSQLEAEYEGLTSASAWLRQAFPVPPPPAGSPNTFSGKYREAWDKMQADWQREQQAASVTPMTCYQKSQVSYIASTVRYDHSQISYLDSTFNPVAEGADRNIAIVLEGPHIVRQLAAAYATRANAWAQFNHNASWRPYLKSYEQQADKLASEAKAVAVPRLASVRKMVEGYDRRAADLDAQADQFPNSITCSG